MNYMIVHRMLVCSSFLDFYMLCRFCVLDEFVMNLMIVPGLLVCNRLLISVCMLIVSKTFAHIKCYSDCSCRGGGWPFG